MVIFFVVFFLLYSVVNFYIFIRGWQALEYMPSLKILYLVVFIILALGYIFAKVFEKKLPNTIYAPLNFIGAFWFSFLMYFILFIILFDSIRLVNSYFPLFPAWINQNYQAAKFAFFIITILITVLITAKGYANSRDFKIKELTINLPRRDSGIENLRVIQISDIHISSINNDSFLESAVKKINELEPDIVLIPGDLVDERASYLKEHSIGKSFLKLRTKYGVFASSGNHEFINGGFDVIEYLEKECGIRWISDSVITIDNAFNLIGRHDVSFSSFTKNQRKSLNELMVKVDPNLPTILLDHTPFKLEEAEQNRIDLQLSGHTHNGQIFPANVITKMIYEQSWGYLVKGKTQYYVSSGLGSWGPPVKLASDAEIVLLNIKFVK